MAVANAGPLHRLRRSPSPAGGGEARLVLPYRGRGTMRSMVEGAS